MLLKIRVVVAAIEKLDWCPAQQQKNLSGYCAEFIHDFVDTNDQILIGILENDKEKMCCCMHRN